MPKQHLHNIIAMYKKILPAVFIAILLIGTAAFFFIKFSNDHKECNDVITKSTNANGEEVVVTEHICKEKYNF